MPVVEETRTVLVLAVEDNKHCVAVRRLVDRLIVDLGRSLTADDLPSRRVWKGDDDLNPGTVVAVLLSRTRDRASELGIRVHGHLDGTPAVGEAKMYMRLFMVVAVDHDDADVLVVARDVDGYPVRHEGFCQARVQTEHAQPDSIAIVGAFPAPEIEAWFIAGFESGTADEEAALERVKKRCGFDPRERPHALTSKKYRDPKDAKRALDDLIASSTSQSLEPCLEAPLGALRERLASSGFPELEQDVKDRLLPKL